jgi:hypothetical protein
MRYRGTLLAGLVAALAVAAAASLLVPTAAAGSTTPYSRLVSASATDLGGRWHLSVVAGSPIPARPSTYLANALAFGYAWVDTATGTAVVFYVHSAVHPASATGTLWRVRSVDLAAGTTAVGGPSGYCVAASGQALGSGALSGATASVSLGRHSTVATPFTLAVAFLVRHDDGCSARHHWGWVVLSSVPL